MAAPIQGHPWGLGASHLPLQLVQPLLHMTAAPAVHPPPVRLAAGLHEMPEAEAAAAGEAGLLPGCRLCCRIVDRRGSARVHYPALACTDPKQTLFVLRRRTTCILPQPDSNQLATGARPARWLPLAGCRSSEVHTCQVTPSPIALGFTVPTLLNHGRNAPLPAMQPLVSALQVRGRTPAHLDGHHQQWCSAFTSELLGPLLGASCQTSERLKQLTE